MKFINTKFITIINGFLTLTGLAMLFSGLIIQMSEANSFDSVQLIGSTQSTVALISLGLMMVLGFGIAFFNGWARINNHHAKHVVKYA